MKITADMIRNLSGLKDIRKSMVFKIAFALGEQSGEDRSDAKWMRRFKDVLGGEALGEDLERD